MPNNEKPEEQNKFILFSSIISSFGLNMRNKFLEIFVHPPLRIRREISRPKTFSDDCATYEEILERCLLSGAGDCSLFMESLKRCQKNQTSKN